MKILMLRGQVPQDRNPQEIVFDNIDECCDVWTQLVFAMTHEKDQTELWYWGGDRKHKFSNNFTERWVPSFKTYANDFKPTVIFCRGGFTEYHHILERFPQAIKIYYGAGARFLPLSGFTDYDIVLQDSPEQVKVCNSKFPELWATLFIKPAADNIFYQMDKKKKYDVCFPANGAHTFKGHDFVYSTVPSDLKLLNLGNKSKIKHPHNVTSYRVLRPKMAENIALCRVGIVAVQSKIDSCPRVIPEMLACGVPIIALNNVRFWREKYIVSGVTGELANKNNFWETVRHVLDDIDNYSPRQYYKRNLSLEHAAKYLRKEII